MRSPHRAKPWLQPFTRRARRCTSAEADASGKLAWQFREPIATLLVDGKTVGRHYAGPTWELIDGSAVAAKVGGRAPGATASDIPLLKLEVTTRRGAGRARQRHNDPKAQYQGWCRRRALRANGRVPQCPVLRRLRLLQEERLRSPARAERQRHYPAPVAGSDASPNVARPNLRRVRRACHAAVRLSPM